MKESSISIVIPTYNGGKRIATCLTALLREIRDRDAEILVVDDGSTDDTAEVVGRFSKVRLIGQKNAGPAAARNHGAQEARGELLLFTDDDCEPAPGWLDYMLGPFDDPEVIGVKGAYRTRQRPLMARFVQAEYEDRHRLMARFRDIDFIDTYSAAFRRARSF
jgi:glycosyltransferase involved in cell wall biosynthesis